MACSQRALRSFATLNSARILISPSTPRTLQLNRSRSFSQQPGVRMSDKSCSPSDRVYRWQEDVENLERYHKGGYHPLQLGDTLQDGQYCVVAKLGFGTYSTVWLAHDTASARLVAIKILIAEDSRATTERSILQLANNFASEKTSKGAETIPVLLDSFTVVGPNGQHQCLVGLPCRCNLSVSREASLPHGFAADTARAVVAQMILGVGYLHGKGIVHGDLHLGNILLRFPDSNAQWVNEVYATCRKHIPEAIERKDGGLLTNEVPASAVMPIWLGLSAEDIPPHHALIQINDFGEAYLPDHESRSFTGCPLRLRPPEAIFEDCSLTYPADIWSLACSIYEMFSANTLFGYYWSNQDHVVAEHVCAIGDLPERWWTSWTAKHRYFVSRGKWDSSRGDIPETLQERVAGMRFKQGEIMSEDEKADILHMLSRMLVYEPGTRISAKELASIQWMQDWGLPALGKVWKS